MNNYQVKVDVNLKLSETIRADYWELWSNGGLKYVVGMFTLFLALYFYLQEFNPYSYLMGIVQGAFFAFFAIFFLLAIGRPISLWRIFTSQPKSTKNIEYLFTMEGFNAKNETSSANF